MEKPLSYSDIKQIQKAKRLGYIFAVMFLFWGVVWNLYYYYTTQLGENETQIIVCVDILIVSTSILISKLINRSHNRDLLLGRKNVIVETIEEKVICVEYEAGSGGLFRKMREIHQPYFIINGYKHPVEKSLYDKAVNGSLVEMHFTSYSDKLLEIKVVECNNIEK